MPTRRTFIKTTTGLSALAIAPSAHSLLFRPLSADVSVGLIGLGRQGRAIMAELQKIEGVTIAAVCDNDERRLELGARRASGAQSFASHTDLLEKMPGVGAIIIATPTHLHTQIAIDAVAAGRHVYCEAPLAHTLDDCRAIVQAARGSDRVFATGMQGRSNPIYKLARTFVLSGSIRDMVTLRGHWHEKNSWRTPASDPARDLELNWRLDPNVSLGLAGEVGVHQFDVFHWYRRKYPVRVSGHGAVRLHSDGREIPDTVTCSFIFDDDVVLQYDASLANSYEDQHELFFGTMGTVKLTWTHGWLFKEADAPTQGWEVYANRQQFHNEEGITLIADATQLASQGKLKEGVGLPHTSLHYALADFLRAIDENTPPVCSAEEGLRACVVALAARDAIRDGAMKDIDHELFKV